MMMWFSEPIEIINQIHWAVWTWKQRNIWIRILKYAFSFLNRTLAGRRQHQKIGLILIQTIASHEKRIEIIQKLLCKHKHTVGQWRFESSSPHTNFQENRPCRIWDRSGMGEQSRVELLLHFFDSSKKNETQIQYFHMEKEATSRNAFIDWILIRKLIRSWCSPSAYRIESPCAMCVRSCAFFFCRCCLFS